MDDYPMVNIAYRDLEGWECIESCYVCDSRFFYLLSIGGEVIPM